MTPPGLTPELIAEAQEIVDALNRDLISAETDARQGKFDPDRVNSLFRSAHSLKGISGMFGLESVSRLAHDLEGVLDGMRLGRVALDAESLDVLFACVEHFGELIAAAAEERTLDVAILEGLIARLQAVTGRSDDAGQPKLADLVELGPDVLSVLTEYEEHRLRENLRERHNLFMLRSSFDLSNFDVGLAEIDAAVKPLGELITKLPSSKPGDPGTIAFDIIVGSQVDAAGLEAALGDDRIEVIEVVTHLPSQEPHRVAQVEEVAESPVEPPDGQAEESATVRTVSRTVRVDIRRLDRLMNLVGELGLTRMAFERISEEIRRHHGFSGLAAELHKEGRNFERRLAELQAGIMEVRMVPLTNLFERMVRIGRKVSRELGREVRIEVAGETTELDKLIVEDLADPLMHLVRNAIDHGIEPPDDRVEAGKDREGVVRLSAAARGNHVVVEVSDDGCGIDKEKTLRAAAERGLVSTERAEELSQRDVFNLLLLPGVSTRTEVSEYSGRGVGMDVVKTRISQLSGLIEIDSEPGRGTAITVTLPITLAIIPALIVSVARQTYAIPLNSVQETLAIEHRDIRTIEGREVISVRGTTVPLVDLRTVFVLSDTDRPDTMFGVIVGVGQSGMALVVDELIGQQDIVIKSLGRRLRNVPGVAGAAELSNQQTILVIDMVDLLDEMVRGGRAADLAHGSR
jgi:two-component system chemotaxis sensor kinase CheA